MSRSGTAAVRVLVALLTGVAVAAQVVQVDAVSLQALASGGAVARDVTSSVLVLMVADAAVSVVAGVLALALAFGADRRRGGRALSVSLAAWGYLLAYAGVVRLLRPSGDGLSTALFDGHFPFVEALGLAGILAFTAAFPAPLSGSDLTAPRALPVGVRSLQALRIRLLTPSGPWLAAAAVALFVLGLTVLLDRPLQDAALTPAMVVVRFAAVSVVVLNLRRSWVLADRPARRRMLWVAVGLGLLLGSIAVLIGGNVLLAVTGWTQPALAWRPVLRNVGLVGLLWGLAMAVFYDGALDSERVLRGVSAVATAATLLLFLAAGLEVLFSQALFAGIALPVGLGTLAAALVSIGVFGPIRSVVGRVLDDVLGELTGDAPAV